MNVSFSILAAGRGTRMEELTKTTNKTLLIHKGKPIISHIVESISKYTKKINIVVNYKKEKVIQHLILNFPEIEFNFIEQDTKTGTGGAISLLEDKSDYYFITMGDMIFHQDDLDGFFDTFKKNPGNYIMSKEVHNPEKYGVLELEGKKIIEIEEKPENPKSNSVNMGSYIFDKSIFEFITKTNPKSNGEIYITDSLKLSLNKGNLFQIYVLKNEFSDLTTSEDLI